jgi:hypothetical protein
MVKKGLSDEKGFDKYAKECLTLIAATKLWWEFIMGTEFRVGTYDPRGCPNPSCGAHLTQPKEQSEGSNEGEEECNEDGEEFPAFPPWAKGDRCGRLVSK